MQYNHNAIIVKTYLQALERAGTALKETPRTPLETAQRDAAAAELKKAAAGMEGGPLKTWANKLVKEMSKNGEDEGK